MSTALQFIEFALHQNVLRFGEFTLKSGRVSPYFFNAGLFNTGAQLATLGRFYAQTIMAANLEFDCLFGPAYKGIPLAASTAVALSNEHQRDIPYAFNRKEVKDHGEGGQIVGAALEGRRVLIIDDVITAGTAFGEAKAIIEAQGATVAGVVIALDRQERGETALSALQAIEQDLNIPVCSIVTLADIIEHIQNDPKQQALLKAIQSYQKQYGADSTLKI